MEEIIEILERRGSFIDKVDGKYFLSDNAHKMDADFLDKLLKKSRGGYLSDAGEIILETISPAELKRAISGERQRIGGEAGCHNLGWWAVQRRNYAFKCPVEFLEPNVARYVKVLNAAGIFTFCSCDGNHPGKNSLLVDFDEPGYGAFTRILWRAWLSELFPLRWVKNKEGEVLILHENDRQQQYDLLNDAAKYIYEHREIIRNMRMDSMKWMTNHDRKHMDSKEVERRFIEEFKSRLKE